MNLSAIPGRSCPPSRPVSRAVDQACDAFEAAWRRPKIESYLATVSESERADLLRELLVVELELRRGVGESPTPEDYTSRFPGRADVVAAAFRDWADLLADNVSEAEACADDAGAPFLSPDQFPHSGGNGGAGRANDTAVDSLPGGLKLGNYEVLGELGRGGMGVVYKARQVGLNRVVALKMVLPGAQPAEGLARFRAEAEAVAQLSHPHIVQIFEIGEHQGRPFFCQEFCCGGSLANRLRGTPLPPAEAAGLVEALARAVQHAHERGIVHRDLKPSNVLLTADGTPKVADFGLAKKLDEQGLTATGIIPGTVQYMAPEQAQGQAVGPAADVYALGAILYECLTGRPPFKAATPYDTLAQVVSEEPVAVRHLEPKVPADLETICHQCLQKEPAKRYASAADVAEDLRRFRAGEPIAARPVRAWERGWRWCRRNPWLAGLTATVFVILAVGTGVARYQALDARAHAKRAEENATEAREQKAKADEKATEAREQKAKAEANWGQMVRTVELSLDMIGPPGAQGEEERRCRLQRISEVIRKLCDPAHGVQLSEPEQAKLKLCSVKVFRLLGEHDQAERECLLAIELLASSADTPRERDQNLGFAYNRLGWVLRDAGKASAEQAFETSIEIRERLVKQFPEDPELRRQLGYSHRALGDYLNHRGRHPEALAWYRRHVGEFEHLAAQLGKEHPLREEAANQCNNVAYCLIKGKGPRAQDECDFAVGAARQAVAILPDKAFFHFTLGVALYRAGRWDEALGALDKASQLRPDSRVSSGAPLFAAMARWQKQDRNQAQKLYDEALAANGQKPRGDPDLLAFTREAAELLGRAAGPASE